MEIRRRFHVTDGIRVEDEQRFVREREREREREEHLAFRHP
jgi:hypothetical protein